MWLSFLVSILLVLKERYDSKRFNLKRNHDVVLLTIWSLMVVNESVSVFTSKKEEWPALVPRYVCSLLVLALGFLAPGIALNHSDENVHLKNDEPKVKKTIF